MGWEEWSLTASADTFSLSVSFCQPVYSSSAGCEPLNSTRNDASWAIATSYADHPRIGEGMFC